MDASEQRIADSLTRHADDAPSDHGLLSTVHGRLRRRRTGRVVGAAVVAVVIVAAGLSVTQSLRTEPQLAPQPVQVGPAAPGWRWESYKTAQIQVPDAWDSYIAGPAPCTFMSGGAARIGRFYDWLPRDWYTCRYAVLPLESRVPYVWFDDVQAPGIKQYDGGWSEETRLLGSTKVSVLAPSEQERRRIIDTARPITGTDAYGCTPTDPDRATEVVAAEADGAEICEYYNGSLIAGSHLPPRSAAQLGKALASNPRGPTATPDPNCQGSGPRTYSVTLHSGAKRWVIRAVGYPGCVVDSPAGFSLLRSGPHSPYDPSSLFDPGGPPIIPPQR